MTAKLQTPSMRDELDTIISRAVGHLQHTQEYDGHWADCFDTGVMPDAQTVISLFLLGVQDEEWVNLLTARMIHMQREDGSWGVYPGDAGDLSTTVECYYALELTGKWVGWQEQRERARKFILAHGGLRGCRNLTKMFLAVGGEIPWSWLPSPRIYSLMFSKLVPLSISDIVMFTRLHIAPMLILSAHQFVASCARGPVLADFLLHQQDRKEPTPATISGTLQRRLTCCLQWLLNEREDDGTLAGYHSSTVLLLFSLCALGYSPHHPDIQSALATMRHNICPIKNAPGAHQQTCNGHVWNTALAIKALSQALDSTPSEAISKGQRYLASAQQQRVDSRIAQHLVSPAGWAFSSNNTKHPDTDDTVACLEALLPVRDQAEQTWRRGLRWLLGMQNKDGGWSAFEKDSTKWWLEWLPANDMKRAMYDPSTPDITGRVVEFLCRPEVLTKSHPAVARATKWLERHQEANGSWFGRWGTTYIYGTWCAVRGLVKAGYTSEHRSIQLATEWLLSVQNPDGGFGEACNSDIEECYVSASSAPSQTAWGLDTLLALMEAEHDELNWHRLLRHARKGAQWLMQAGKDAHWEEEIPTGSAFPGALHIRYHIYPKVWPLLALCRYRSLMETMEGR